MKIFLLTIIYTLLTIPFFCQVYDVEYSDTLYTKTRDSIFGRELKDSLQDGTYNMYFPCNKKNKSTCGKLLEVGTYVNSVKNGINLIYQINDGIHYLSSLKTYSNGILSGQSYAFTKKGELSLKGMYEKGERVGEWFILNYSSNPDIHIVTYENGTIKEWRIIDKNGSVLNKGEGIPNFMLDLKSN